MIAALALLAAAAAPAAQTVVDAERAFAAMARREGQWTAFRATAAPDAVMFVPAMTNAQAWLKERADPKEAIRWWPVSALVSCDGTLAVSTGGWTNNGGKAHGVFTTIWRKGPDGWKWVLDQGHDTPEILAVPPEAPVTRAVCTNTEAARDDAAVQPAGDVAVQVDNAPPCAGPEALQAALALIADAKPGDGVLRDGRSADGTLRWRTRGDAATGLHELTVFRWNGAKFEVARIEFSQP